MRYKNIYGKPWKAREQYTRFVVYRTGIVQHILAQLMTTATTAPPSQPKVSMGQMKIWFTPQKAGHDHDYNINSGYFESLLRQSVGELLKEGYLESCACDIEDGDGPKCFA